MEHSTINLREDLPVLQMSVATLYRSTILGESFIEFLIMLNQLACSRTIPLLVGG